MRQESISFTQTGDMTLPLVSAFEQELKEKRFVPYFQTQCNYTTGMITGIEVLARLQESGKGVLPPAAFIEIMEKEGTVWRLDQQIFEKTAQQMREWLDEGLSLPTVSINLSRQTLVREDLISSIQSVLEKNRLVPSMFHLEITESVYMEDYACMTQKITELQNIGFHIEMDDFGSGYSSLSCLKDAPVDVLKLDTRFLSIDGKNSRKGANILSSVVRLAHGLALPVIAEGVENKSQADFLRSIGCYYMQGFYFSKPMPAKNMEALLEKPLAKIAGIADETEVLEDSIDFLDNSIQSALIFNSFVGGAMILDYRGENLEILRVNQKLARELETDEAVLFDRDFNFLKILHETDRAGFTEMLEKAAATWNETDCETCLDVPGNEREIWIHCRARCLARKNDGYIIYVAVENITDRVMLNRSKSMLSASLAAIIHNAPGGLARFRILNGKPVCEYFNDGFCNMRGFNRAELSELLKGGIENTVHPDDYRYICKTIAAMSRDNPKMCFVFRALCKDGGYISIEINGSYIEDDKGSIIYVHCSDKTDQVKSASLLRINEQENKIVDRLSAMGRLICHFDIPNKTMYAPLEYTRRYGAPQTIRFPVSEEYVKSILKDEQAQNKFVAFYDAIMRGDPVGIMNSEITLADGSETQEKSEFVTIYDQEGNPIRAVIAIEDTKVIPTGLAKAEKRLDNLYEVLEITEKKNIKSAFVLNIKTGECRMCQENTHSQIKYISYLRSEEWKVLTLKGKKDYYRNMLPETVAKSLQEANRYTVNYLIREGWVEADFHWYDAEHDRVLLVVKMNREGAEKINAEGKL